MPEWNSRWTCRDLVMGHAAVTDLDTGTHVFSELLYRAVPFLGGFPPPPGGPGLADSLVAWSRAPAGTDTTWSLRWTGNGFRFEMVDSARRIGYSLDAVPLKPVVLEGPNGFSRKSADGAVASQYYSFTRMRTSGVLTSAGRDYRVEGESWMDREFASGQLSEEQEGWDWFSLQLDDGSEIMLYLLRNRSGTVDYASGTVVPREGAARYLTPGEFRVEVLGTWKSPATGAAYPARWRVMVPGLPEIEIEPEVPDQENRSRLAGGLFYWEGAVRVLSSRRTFGRGFVELTGYGTHNRPAL